MKISVSIRNYIIHFTLAIYLSATAMPWFFQGRSNMFSLSVVVSVFTLQFFSFLEPIKNIKRNQLMAFLFFCLLFFFNKFIFIDSPAGETAIKTYFQFYLIAGACSLLVVNYRYDYEIFLRSLILLGLVIAPVMVRSNYSTLLYYVDNDEWMTQIYSITPFLVGSIHYLYIGRKKLFKLLAIVCIASYFSMYIKHTPRGAVVIVATAILFFTIQKKIEQGVSFKRILMRGGGILIAAIIAWQLLLGYLRYLSATYNLRWLAKFVFEEDVSNNRFPLYEMAWNGFLDSPIIGKGIATFLNCTNYPHNLFLQMLYETGLLVFPLMCYLLYQALCAIFSLRKTGIYDYKFITFFFVISMGQLMFSSYYWRNISFWMMIWTIMGMLITKHNILKK